MIPTVDSMHDAFQALMGGAGGAPSVGTTGAPAMAPASGEGSVSVPAPVIPPGVPALRRADPAKQGWHLDLTVAPDQVVAAAELIDRRGFAIDCVTGVDWIAAGEMEIVYDFYHPLCALHVVVRARVPRSNPELPTISGVFPGANWHERETHDFFGIRFLGHPDLTPLLLPEDADYHPLRKDFAGAA
jgi:NADH-quinone oxidoreductase subunit C